MQEQEANLTATDHLFRLLPWIEDNLKRIALVVALVLVAIFIYSFYSYRLNEQGIAAGQALTQAAVFTDGSQRAATCLKIADEYPGTVAGQRALIQGATALFTTGKYADAQAAFQKFLDTYHDNFFTPQATLGVAASLDALGKTDLAISGYQKAAAQTASPNVAANAKFSLARIDQAQGKLAEAAKLFTEVARTYPNTSLASEAGMRALELKAKLPAVPVPAATTTTTNLPFNISK
ncbi:MAG: tetratricopeptide repeat protein [Limisphaerales bacterium]